MKWTDVGWACGGSITLGVFLYNQGPRVPGIFFLGLGVLFLAAAVLQLLSQCIPSLNVPANISTVIRVSARLGAWPFYGAMIAILAYWLWGKPSGATIREEAAATLKYREANASYLRGRDLYLGFTVDSFQNAENHYHAALTKWPNSAKAHAALAELYSVWASIARYRGEDAEALSEKATTEGLAAITLEPNLSESQRGLSAALTQAGQQKLALEEVNRSLASDPDDREAKFWKWVAEGERDDPTYFQAIQGDADYDFPIGLVRVGFSLASYGKSEEARTFFNRAESLAHQKGKEIPLVHVGLANTYMHDAGAPGNPGHKEKVDAAIRELEAALRLDGRLIIAHSNLGNKYLAQQDWADALGHFEDALQIEPKYEIATYNKSIALYEMGNVQSAKSAWDETARLSTLAVEPRSLAFGKLAQALRLSLEGQTTAATNAYREAVEAGRRADPQLHLDSVSWCSENEVLGPQGIALLKRLLTGI